MATEVTGAQTLAAAVKDATARNGWRQKDLDPESKKAMADDDEHRERQGLSERTWLDICRGKKTKEMDLYSYAVIDATLEWKEGTAWALHHDQELPVDEDKLDSLLARVEQIDASLSYLLGLVEEEREKREGLERQVAGMSEGMVSTSVLVQLLRETRSAGDVVRGAP